MHLGIQRTLKLPSAQRHFEAEQSCSRAAADSAAAKALLKAVGAAAKEADGVYQALLGDQHCTPTAAVYQGMKCEFLSSELFLLFKASLQQSMLCLALRLSEVS